MDLWAIGQALAAHLTTAGIAHVTNYAPDTVNPPCVIAPVPPVDYDQTFGPGLHDVKQRLIVFTSRAVDVVGQQQLAQLAGTGPSSVKACLEQYRLDGSDPPGADLGVSSLQVQHFQPISAEDIAAYKMFGGEFTVQLYVED